MLSGYTLLIKTCQREEYLQIVLRFENKPLNNQETVS